MYMGFGKPKTGLFGAPLGGRSPYETPGIGDGMTVQHTPQERVAAQPTEPKKSGLFGKGGVGRAIAGTIGDFLMQRSGMAPVYAPTMMQERQAAAQAAAEQRKRAEELADFRTKEGIKAEYSRPAIEDNYDFIMRTAGPEAANRYVNTYGQKPDEPRMVSIPGRGSFFGTMDEVQAWLRGNEPSNVPARPVGGLTPMGGGAGNSVGGF